MASKDVEKKEYVTPVEVLDLEKITTAAEPEEKHFDVSAERREQLDEQAHKSTKDELIQTVLDELASSRKVNESLQAEIKQIRNASGVLNVLEENTHLEYLRLLQEGVDRAFANSVNGRIRIVVEPKADDPHRRVHVLDDGDRQRDLIPGKVEVVGKRIVEALMHATHDSQQPLVDKQGTAHIVRVTQMRFPFHLMSEESVVKPLQ